MLSAGWGRVGRSKLVGIGRDRNRRQRCSVRPGPLRVEATDNGPVVLRGNLRLMDATGDVVAQMSRCILCRCGQSKEKPFCDGTHQQINFTS